MSHGCSATLCDDSAADELAHGKYTFSRSLQEWGQHLHISRSAPGEGPGSECPLAGPCPWVTSCGFSAASRAPAADAGTVSKAAVSRSAPGVDPAWECPLAGPCPWVKSHGCSAASCAPAVDAARSGAGCACRARRRHPAHKLTGVTQLLMCRIACRACRRHPASTGRSLVQASRSRGCICA